MQRQTWIADQMIKKINEDTRLQADLKDRPVETLTKVKDEAAKEYKYSSDRALYLIAIIVLGLLTLTTAGGAIGLAIAAIPIPEVLIALGSAAVGALVGLFAKSPTEQ